MSASKKVCKGPCGRELLLGFFHKSKQSKDGHRSVCCDCVSRYKAHRRALKKKTRSFNWDEPIKPEGNNNERT